MQAAFVSLVHFSTKKSYVHLFFSTTLTPLLTFCLSSRKRTNIYYRALMLDRVIFVPLNFLFLRFWYVFDYILLVFSAKDV